MVTGDRTMLMLNLSDSFSKRPGVGKRDRTMLMLNKFDILKEGCRV